MRRLVLGSAVLFIAACGGGAVPDSGLRPDAPSSRRAIPNDHDTAVFVEALIASFGEDAVDACLAAWQDSRSDAADVKERVYKPAESFRAFLRDCLDAPDSGGGDLRSADGDMRGLRGGALRSRGTN